MWNIIETAQPRKRAKVLITIEQQFGRVLNNFRVVAVRDHALTFPLAA